MLRKGFVMKRILRVVLILSLVVGVSIPSFAAKVSKDKKYNRIVAQVVSVNATAQTMVVKEEKTGESRTIKISAKAASQVKVGDRVRIKLNPGTNESVGVRVLKDHSKDEATIPAEPNVETVSTAPEKK
jgi:hypothetical protein